MICIPHILIARLQAFLVFVKSIRVFHQKLTGPVNPEARTFFIPVLRLNLIQIQRQLLIGGHFSFYEIGKVFFRGRSEAELPVVAVAQFEHFGAVYIPAAGFIP